MTEKLFEKAFPGLFDEAQPDRNFLVANVVEQLRQDGVLPTDAAVVNAIRQMAWNSVALLAKHPDGGPR